MNRVIKTQLVVAVLVVLTCALASAQSHSLKETYFVAGPEEVVFAIPAQQWTPVRPPVNIVCPGSGTCTIEAVQSIQVGPSEAGNCFLIDCMLDGNLLVSAPQVGEIPAESKLIPEGQCTSFRLSEAAWSMIPPATWPLGLSNCQSEFKSRLESLHLEDKKSG